MSTTIKMKLSLILALVLFEMVLKTTNGIIIEGESCADPNDPNVMKAKKLIESEVTKQFKTTRVKITYTSIMEQVVPDSRYNFKYVVYQTTAQGKQVKKCCTSSITKPTDENDEPTFTYDSKEPVKCH